MTWSCTVPNEPWSLSMLHGEKTEKHSVVGYMLYEITQGQSFTRSVL